MSDLDVIHGDSIDVMRSMPADSVDAVVTDPPYGLEFMGREWDGFGTPRGYQGWCEAWAREAIRVLKPGGHLVAFGGTRTYHRLTCGLEDAGFEIRDSLSWGHMRHVFCQCSPVPYSHASTSHGPVPAESMRGVREDVAAADAVPVGAEQNMQPGLREGEGERPEATRPDGSAFDPMRGLRDAGTPAAEPPCAHCGAGDVLAPVQWGSTGPRVGEARPQGSCLMDGGVEGALAGSHDGGDEPLMEGGSHPSTQSRESRGGALREVPGLGDTDGEGGRVRDGAPPSDGETLRIPTDPDGSGASPEPRLAGQPAGEPRTLAVEWIPQGGGAWPGCPRCHLPLAPPFDAGPLIWGYGSGFPKSLNLPGGWGTALKPAHEPAVLARKPLAGTVARNVLQHGTGALNIDGCRIGTTQEERDWMRATARPNGPTTGWGAGDGPRMTAPAGFDPPAAGRWPANVALDDVAAAMLDEQVNDLHLAGNRGGTPRVHRNFTPGQPGGTPRETAMPPGYQDPHTGPSRFFYTAKASKRERGEGNTHPTVKPVALMRWVVRLVTAPGGVVLDPFAGSGTTALACRDEGFSCILVEREQEYVDIIRRRVDEPQLRIAG